MSVGDIRTLSEAKAAFQNGTLSTVVTIEGKPLTSVDTPDISNATDGLDDELTKRLATIDESMHIPYFLEDKYRERLTECDMDRLQAEVDAVITERGSDRLILTTIFFRFATVGRQDYYEEFLGIQPPHFGFNAPTVEGDGVSQVEINRRWELGDKDMTLELSFREDIYELAKSLKEWVEDPSEPFPFQLNQSDALNFHYSKTRMSITFEKIIDRRWYLERQVMFRFRPVSKAERYGLELEYWKAEGDDRRSRLIDELFQKAVADEMKVQNSKSPPGTEESTGSQDKSSPS